MLNFIKSLCLAIVLFASLNSVCQMAPDLQVEEYETAIRQPGIQLLDVRTAAEYAGGHLKNSFQADWTNRKQFADRVASLDKKLPVYTYCLSGGRSSAAASWLREKGFIVYNMTGGIVMWQKAGKPVEGTRVVPQITMDEYLDKIPSDKSVLVDIGATWCPPCKKMKPVMDSVRLALGEGLKFIAVDGGEQAGLVKQLDIVSFPTFIIYKHGKETWRGQGIIDRKVFLKEL